MQDLNDRPIWFYPAEAICDTQLQAISGHTIISNKAISSLLNPLENSTAITLEQYENLVQAGLTQDAKCAGMTSGANAVQFAAGLFLQWFVGAAAVMGMLMRM